jgi:ABC-type sugar transport system substrate-binding protein
MSQGLQATIVRVRLALMGSLMGVVWSGCGDGDFVPPPPPVARDTGGGASRGTAAARDPFTTGGTVRSIDFIQSPRLDPEEAAIERSTARSQAGFEKARVHLMPVDDTGTPDEGSSPTQGGSRPEKSQVELVRGAITRKPQAVIIEPEDPASEELGRAIQEVRAAKIPVVVIGGPIAGTSAGSGLARLVHVRPQPFADSARQLVALAMRNARNAKLNPQGGAIVVITEPGDLFQAERLKAVREALKDAKITAVEELRVPKTTAEAADLLKKRLQADTKPSLVISIDLTGSTVSNTIAGEIIEKRPFIQVGYTSESGMGRMALMGEFAAIAEFMPNRLIQRAITNAIALAQGRDVREPDELVVTVRESPATAVAPHMQYERMKSRQEKSKEE